MENNTNEINNEEENNNVMILDENKTEKGNLFLPIQVENYLNVIS